MKFGFENETLIIDKKTLLAVIQFASQDSTSPTLNQLRVEPSRLIATDGHALVVVGYDEEPIEPFGVPIKWLIKQLKPSEIKVVGLRKVDGMVYLERRDSKQPSVVLSVTSVHECGERFPSVDSVIPARGKSVRGEKNHFTVDPMLFARLGKLSAAIDKRSPGVRLQHHRKLDAVRFDLETNELDVHGCIMPMRGSD